MSYPFTDKAPEVAEGETPLSTLRFAAEFLLWLVGLVALVTVFAFAVISPAFAEVTAKVETRKETGFGRLVFNFDRLPGYTSELASGVLVLTFDEPVVADISTLPVKAAGYVAIARRDPDGRAFRLALSRAYKVNLMEAGRQLFVDILPTNWKGHFPGLPAEVIKELARLAAEAERRDREEARQRRATMVADKLEIRLARHPTFTRIVFDWNKFVTVHLSRNAHKVRIEFGREAKVDLSRLNVDPPPFLKSAKMEKLDPGMAITLTIDQLADVRGFREELGYVVDLSGPDAAVAAATEDAEEAVAGLEASGPEIPAAAASGKTKIAGSGDGQRNQITKTPTGWVTTELMQLPLDVQTDDHVQSALGPGHQLAETREVPTRAQSPPSSRAPAPEVAGAAPEESKKTAAEVSAPAATGETPPETERMVPAAAGPAKINVRVMAEGPNLRLVFPFRAPVAAAAFRRGRTIWLVFDTATPMDGAALRADLEKKVSDLDLQSDGSAQYIRLTMSRPWLTYMSGERDSWTVTIGDMIVGKATPLSLTRSLREDRRSVMTIPLTKPGRVHWLKDPDVGDRLAIVTAHAPARNVAKPQDFVEFSAIATAHGIAISPKSEDVGVRLRLDEVLITRHKGLTLSAGHKHQYAPGKKALDPSARVGFLDLATWQVQVPAVLSKRIHELQRVIAVTPDDEKNWLRLSLARLYLANDLVPETIGILKRMQSADPTVASDPAFNVMRAAAHVLMGRTKEARKDLDVHALANDADAALWRGLLAAREQDWETALSRFRLGVDAVGSYRIDLRARFHLAAARAALELAKLDRAAEELEALPEEPLPAALQADADLLKGRYLAEIGRHDEALEAFDQVLKGSERPAVAEAELRTIALLLRMKKIPVADAVKSLERLQLIWRGDDVELGTLRLLASLYVGEGRHRDAFAVMKNAVIAYPKAAIALQIQDDMKEVFRRIFLKDGGRSLEPIQALSLYYDYRELTPVGRMGDVMIRRLAERLTDVDLLDQAAELLDHQVHNRLKGAARAHVATRLAMVHLMNRKPELALKEIRQTRQAGLPGELLRRRSLLEARALGELGRAEAAVEILSTLEGPDVERQKADALWSAQRWQRAGEQLEKLLGVRWQESEPLKDSERFDVLRAAIAYSLAEDQFALDRMSKKFYAKMMKSPDAESFTLVTEPVNGTSADFRKLAREVAATDTLDAFMAEFRRGYDLTRDNGAAELETNQENAG